MKSLNAIATAALVAVTLTALPGQALAWKQLYAPHVLLPPPVHHHHHDNGDLFVAGALGLIGGAVIAGAMMPPAQPQPVYVQPVTTNAHVAWCANRYRSYNAGTNTWVDLNGNLRICQSPYGY